MISNIYMKSKIIIFITIIVVVISGFLLWQSKRNEEKTLVNEPVPQNTVSDLSKIQNPTITFELDLQNKNLKSLPSGALELTNLKKINLSNNQITSLPSEIGRFTNLEEFIIEHNLLTGALPAEINKWPKLKKLDASDNGLTGVPAEVGQLPGLKTLDFGNNKITALPNEFENLTGLLYLDLKNNSFSQIPPSLKKMTQLKTLNLTGNPISPSEIDALKKLLSTTDIIY